MEEDNSGCSDLVVGCEGTPMTVEASGPLKWRSTTGTGLGQAGGWWGEGCMDVPVAVADWLCQPWPWWCPASFHAYSVKLQWCQCQEVSSAPPQTPIGMWFPFHDQHCFLSAAVPFLPKTTSLSSLSAVWHKLYNLCNHLCNLHSFNSKESIKTPQNKPLITYHFQTLKATTRMWTNTSFICLNDFCSQPQRNMQTAAIPL